MGMPWLKLSNAIRRDPQISMLAKVDICNFIFILNLKGEGLLDAFFPDSRTKDCFVAKELGITPKRADKLKQQLVRFRLIDGNWQPLQWEQMQAGNAFGASAADSSGQERERTAAAERVRKCRERKKADVTPVTDDVTPVTDDVTPVTLHVTGGVTGALQERYKGVTCNVTGGVTAPQKAPENFVENQQVANAPLDIDIDIDLDRESDRDSEGDLEEEHSKSIAAPVASDPSAAAKAGDSAHIPQTDSKAANLRFKADENQPATLASESRSIGLKTQQNANAGYPESGATEEAAEGAGNAVSRENTQAQSPHLTPESPLLPLTVAAPPAKASKKPKPEPSPLQALCRETWDSFAASYQHRYRTEPVRNQKVNSQIKLLCERLGKDAPQVAAHYVTLSDQWYVRNFHSINLLLSNCEGIHTAWKTGSNMNSVTARQMECTQANVNAAKSAIEKLARADLSSNTFMFMKSITATPSAGIQP